MRIKIVTKKPAFCKLLVPYGINIFVDTNKKRFKKNLKRFL